MEHRKARYQMMCMAGTLKQHLMDVNDQAHRMLEAQIALLLEAQPAPDKATNQMGWVQHMNSLKAQAEEIVLRELIYV